jgi:diaminohydroxyphosphoribosylaminopyrimidine deaminase/5-amino-6-(5-phosphoribosylamino)uracil reductase
MVGAGTARSDDPMLTVRGFGDVPQPVRVVLSRRLDLPLEGHLARTAAEVPVWLCHGREASEDAQAAWRDRGARLIEIPSGAGGHLDVTEALAALGDAGLTRVFCEGGGTLAAALLAADLVDTLWLVTAGRAIGAEGTPALGAMGVASLSEAPSLRLERCQNAG